MATATKKTSTKIKAQTSGDVGVGNGKRLRGRVVKTGMVGTITVKVDRFVQHPKYKKYYSIAKKYLVDDKSSEGKNGDLVEIVETRPLSKLKRFRLVAVIERAKGADIADDQ